MPSLNTQPDPLLVPITLTDSMRCSAVFPLFVAPLYIAKFRVSRISISHSLFLRSQSTRSFIIATQRCNLLLPRLYQKEYQKHSSFFSINPEQKAFAVRSKKDSCHRKRQSCFKNRIRFEDEQENGLRKPVARNVLSEVKC